MRILNKKNNIILLTFCFTGILKLSAQDSTNLNNSTVFTTVKTAPPSDPTITIHQDPKIQRLLDIKTKMDKDGVLNDNYKIQLYYGNIKEANNILNKAKELFPQWKSDIIWETPNYKVWIGNYRNKLETDRALKEIKPEFSNAFSFKPEQK